MDIIFQKIDQLVNEGGRIITSEFKDRFPSYYRYAIYLDTVAILFNDEKYLRIEIEDLRKLFCVGEYEGYMVSTVMEKHGWKSVGHTLATEFGFSSLEQMDASLP